MKDRRDSESTFHKKWRKPGLYGMLWLIALVFSFGAAKTAVIEAVRYWFYDPCRLEAGCVGESITAEGIRGWEERVKDDSQGIKAVAGWRTEEKRMVISIATGRSHEAQTMAVYGSMELAFPTKILAGVYGLVNQEESCVISEKLADALFGSVDVAGEEVCFWQQNPTGKEEKRFVVAGVIKREEECLLFPMEAGEVDGLAVQFDMRFQAREKMTLLIDALRE